MVASKISYQLEHRSGALTQRKHDRAHDMTILPLGIKPLVYRAAQNCAVLPAVAGNLLRMQRFIVQAAVIFGLLLAVDLAPAVAETDRGFLTSQQKQWLATHAAELQIAPEANYPPFSFVDAGVWRGISADVVNLVEGKLGARFHILPAQNLDSILDRAQRGEVGIVTSVTETPERSQYLAFTQSYISVPIGKNVAVGKGYGVQKFLEKNFPSLKLVLVPDDLEGLRRLSIGEVDAAIMDVASARFLIDKEKLGNLHVLSSVGFTYELSFAVRKDMPILREILISALQVIPDRDKRTIVNDWHANLNSAEIVGARYQRFLSHGLAILVLLIAATTTWMVVRRRVAARKGDALDPNEAHPRLQPGRSSLYYAIPASVALLISLAALVIVWQELAIRHERNLHDAFEFETQRITTKVRERMRAYAHILRSGAGIFAGSDKVKRDQWRAFVDKLDLGHSYRGIQGVGFSLLIPKTGLNDHIREIRRQGFPDYNVRPAGEREVYTSIIYLEPFTDRNLRAFGYDMFAESVRNEAMSRARDTGEVALSDKVELVQETSADIQAGLLAYFAVYKNGAMAQTREQRRAALLGWVYSPYRMNDLLTPVLESELRAIRLEIFDEGTASQNTLLFDNQHDSPVETATDNTQAISSIQRIEIGGRYWTLRYTALPGYAEASTLSPLWNELLALSIIGVLLLGLTMAFINTRRRAEVIAHELTDSLRQSEERWKFALEGAGDGVWDWDIASEKMTFSKRWYEIQGIDEGTVGPAVAAWEQLVHPDDLPLAKAALQAHFDGKTPNFACEHRVRCGNGEYKWILGRGMVVARNAAGRPVRMIGTHTDISERIRADLMLRESESRFRSMADTAPVLIWVSGKDKLCNWFNKVWLDFTGRSMEQEMGNGWTEGVHPEDLDRCLEIYVSHFEQRKAFRMEYRLKRRDGEYRWIDEHGVPRFGADGRFEGYIGSCIDIHDSKQANVERDRLLRIIEEAPDFIATSDMQAHLKFLNNAGARLVGLPEGVDLASLEIKDMHPGWGAQLVLEEGIPTVLESGFWQHENALINRDGHEIPVSQVLLVHRDANGTPQILSTIMRDISERKRTEQELISAREAAEAANRAKSEFLANMSHEIRTPLNGVLGNAQLLEMSGPTSEQKEYLSAIMLSGSNLLSLINDILDLSKIEADKIVLEKRDFSLRDCFNDVVRAQRSRIANKGLTLRLNIPNEAPDALIGDELRVKQILLNLLGNAIKFTDQGSITLSATLKEQASDSALIELSVSDTGIGIPKAVAEDIFKPFVQADSSITRQYGGSGLGLTISRRLAELMGGTISVASVEGAGSNFQVLLPFPVMHQMVREHSTPAAETPTALWTGAPLKVLLAEDNEINQQFGVALLKKMGHVVALAENGKEALAALENDRFDLVLMDIQMPVMDGGQALVALRERESNMNAHLPVIALTAHALKGDEEKFLAQGFDGYISKPLEVKKLVAEMRRVLN
ncbi:MAG: CHASE domain-containing protein [Proteobacteria bacterium]|nr:CHASE domain-containing protein [Pseudomonadota bacterium]